MDAPQHVVVGFDGSSLSEFALHRALRMTRSAPFALVHVVSVVREDGDRTTLPSGETLSRWGALESVRLTVAELGRQWNESQRNVRVVAHLRTGEVARALVDFAYRYHADQIVMGAHSSKKAGAYHIGSTTLNVLALTEIPVHVESPFTGRGQPPEFSAMRWAYVFGAGGTVRRRGALSPRLDQIIG